MSAKTIDLKLKGDMVNSGLMAARGNLSIDAANITNLTGTLKGMDVSLIAAGDFQSIQGNIVAGKALKINAGNDVVVLAGNITAGGSASITAGHDLLLLAQDKGRQVSANWGAKDKDGKLLDPNNKDNYVSYGTYDQTGVSMNIGGALTMSAGNDFVAQGSQINAGAISVSAGRDASITTAQHGSFYESNQVRKESTWFGLGSKTTTHTTRNTDITNTETNWNAGAINVGAGRDLTIVGGNFNAGSINLSAGNNANILAAYDIKEKISINAVKTNDIGRLLTTTFNGPALNGINTRPTDTSTTDIDSARTAKLANLNAGAGGVNISAGNNVNLEAPNISGSSLNVTAGTSNAGGKVNLIAAIDSREVSHTVTSRNTLWQSNASSGQINQTLHMANIQVPANNINFQGAGGITVQLPKGSALPAQIAALAKQPGNEYLGDLAKRSDIDWKQIEVINKTWDYKKEGITQEAAIIIAIVVTIFTAGAAASAAGSIVGTTAATATTAATLTGTGLAAATGMSVGVAVATTAAVAAGITTLATQAAIALLNNKGDVAGALKELGSKENIKALAVAMVTAGAVQGLGAEFGLVSGGKATLLQNLQTNLVNGVAGSLISTAINGGSLEDALKNVVKNAVINALASQGADAIGNANMDIFSSNLAHAILGCAVGSATAGNSSGCAAGAGGAVVGHLSAQWYDANITGATDTDIANFAKLTTALASLVGGANAMNIAGVTSSNAVVNNYLTHKQDKIRNAASKACTDSGMTNTAACNTASKLNALDIQIDNLLQIGADACKAGNDQICRDTRTVVYALREQGLKELQTSATLACPVPLDCTQAASWGARELSTLNKIENQLRESGQTTATVGPEALIAGPAAALGRLAALGFTLGAGFDAAGQYVQSGTVRPEQSFVAGVTGAAALTLARGGGYIIGATTGAGAAGLNTVFNNAYYGDDYNVFIAASLGGAFGVVGTYGGGVAANYFSYTPRIPVSGTTPTFRPSPSWGSPYAPSIGNAVSNTVGGIPSFIPSVKNGK